MPGLLPSCGQLPHHRFYVWCCHSPVATLYILLECKVFICVDSLTVFLFCFLLIFFLMCIYCKLAVSEPLPDEDAPLLWKRLKKGTNEQHPFGTNSGNEFGCACHFIRYCVDIYIFNWLCTLECWTWATTQSTSTVSTISLTAHIMHTVYDWGYLERV